MIPRSYLNATVDSGSVTIKPQFRGVEQSARRKKPCLQHGMGGQSACNGPQEARPQHLHLRREEWVQPALELEPQAHLPAPLRSLQLPQVLQSTAQHCVRTNGIAVTGRVLQAAL